jgi:DNA polymerase sigma
VSYYIQLQPICKKLIIFVKNWAALLNFGVNSYMWTLMVIFYLQQEHLLPPVKGIQDMVKPMFIEEWNVAFGTPNLSSLRMPQVNDFRHSLVGFFKFYGHQFDFTNYIICPLTGTRVPKHIFDHGKENLLPPVFKTYANYMGKLDLEEANEIDDLFANFKPLVVQDPFELIHNVGKGVQEQKLLKIIHYMRATLEILTIAQN